MLVDWCHCCKKQ